MAFLTSKPPREFSLLSRLTILFGGISSQIGWAIFAFGMFFFWGFVMNSDWKDFFSSGKWDSKTAEIVKKSPTSLLENKQTIYEYEYTYTLAGKTYTGKSYSVIDQLVEGQEVAILYNEENPKKSKMEGGKSAPFGRWVIYLIFFPLVGLFLILYSLRRNSKFLSLLVHGKGATGKQATKETTKVKINYAPVFKYIFDFQAENGKTYQASGRTHLTHLVESEEGARVIYSPKNPTHATLFDLIPIAPDIASSGPFLPKDKLKIWVLILPALTILGNIAYALFA